ncbi:hypothetical protein K438DRAFT_1782092 [Mycena galopus ATCC 62051]|nr:hypothetical protein K438DRAFT_1782092 [Mycena galopus ATCC 62051]
MSYFRLCSVILKTCSGSDNEHFQLERIKWCMECQLNPLLCEIYKGTCWQAWGGRKFCDGNPLQYEVVLNLPIMLVVEMGDLTSSPPWDIPTRSLRIPKMPLPLRTGPFTSQLAIYPSTEGKLAYSIMMAGNAKAMQSFVVTHSRDFSLVAVIQLRTYQPDILNVVVYHLDGGEAAQRFFHKEQIQAAKKLHLQFETKATNKTGIPSSCQLVCPNLEILTDEDRWWLASSLSAVDYISRPPEKSPRKKWHPPMARVGGPDSDSESTLSVASSTPVSSEKDANTVPLQRILSIPPIDTMEPPSAPSAPPKADAVLRCWPCFSVADDSDILTCHKCGFWSHAACVARLGYLRSDSESDASESSLHDPGFVFVCMTCKVRDPTPECDEELNIPGAVRMLPEMEDWTHATRWFPTQFVDFDLLRTNSEYKLKWIEGIVWSTEPQELTFHRSLAQWEEITSCERRREEQPIGEDAASLDPQLSHLFLLAVPTIAQVLAASDAHPVLRNFKTHFKSTSWNVQASLDWMRKCSFQPSPALHQMLTPALAALSAHSLMRSDPMANRKIWGPGLILFQLLAIQHSLNEPWDLNGDTFLRIQAEDLVPSPPAVVEGLNIMWKSTDPIVRTKESQITTTEFGPLEETFKGYHAVYETSSALIFYRQEGNWTTRTHASPEPIRIQHIG